MSVKEMPNENPTITEASSFYLNKKEKELRHDTLRSYRSKLNFFKDGARKKVSQIGSAITSRASMRKTFLTNMGQGEVHTLSTVCYNT